jgi:serralysin
MEAKMANSVLVNSNAVSLGTWDERVTGTVFADRLFGGFGDDTIIGAGGNDTIYGGDGLDDLYGGAGNDLLYGNEGSDLMVGGTGSDAFIFNTRPEGTGAAEMDYILDFKSNDVVILDNADFPSLGAAGWLPAFMFKTVGTRASVDSNDRLVYNKLSGVLTYDFNGSQSGGRIVLADFSGNPTLTADDFYII